MPTPAPLAAFFAATPRATFALTEIGHAYGKAKYPGRCPITGTPIHRNGAIRRVEGVTADGRSFSCHIPAAALQIIESCTVGSVRFKSPRGLHTVKVCGWAKVGADFDGMTAAAIEGAGVGDSLMISAPSCIHGEDERKEWTLLRSGKWWRRGGAAAGVSAKQLQSSVKRARRTKMWAVLPALV